MGVPAGPLGEVVTSLVASRAAAQVIDAHGRLVWVSDEMIKLSGGTEETELGLGQRLEPALDLPVWQELLTPETRELLRHDLGPRLTDPARFSPLWVLPIELQMGRRRRAVGMLGVHLRHPDGAPLGTALVYAPLLPARVLALVSEGDEAMFTRMADLSAPSQRPAAVVFADIDGSGPLSRRLPTPVYFELIRAVTTAFDDLTGRFGGIVGKHAGDGASAFFLTEGLGSDSAAARSALRLAQALPGAVARVVDDLAASGADLAPADCRLNIGVHWGADLFIGQVVTGGRLEVTALGDEVNECARVEQVAHGGQCLVTKHLIERLDAAAAGELGLEPRALSYRVLADLVGDAGHSAKAERDAGSLAVHEMT